MKAKLILAFVKLIILCVLTLVCGAIAIMTILKGGIVTLPNVIALGTLPTAILLTIYELVGYSEKEDSIN